MTPRTRLLAIDPGKVRLGLAVSDAERRLASPLTTYTRRNPALDAQFFKKIVADEDVAAIVIGLPIHEDGPLPTRWLNRIAKSQLLAQADLASYLLFDGAYAKRLIQLGMEDTHARRDQLVPFFEAPSAG